MDGPELERMTFEHLPRPFLKSLTRSVFVARRDAWNHCRAEFARPEADNLRGFYARAKLEGLMRSSAERFGITAEAVREPGQPWNHTEIRSGPVVLTAASVRTPCGMVEDADYRSGLARSGQLRFFGADPPPDAPLYMLLLHSRGYWLTEDERTGYGHLPGSIYLAYPAADLDVYLHRVNLFDGFPDVVQEFTPEEWDEEALLRYLDRARRFETA
jgi:hypothetical protein